MQDAARELSEKRREEASEADDVLKLDSPEPEQQKWSERVLRDKGDATRLKSKGNELSQPHKRADDAKDRATSFLNVDPIKVQI